MAARPADEAPRVGATVLVRVRIPGLDRVGDVGREVPNPAGLLDFGERQRDLGEVACVLAVFGIDHE